MNAAATYNENEVQRAWKILEGVADPEIPVLSVVDLGIVRNIQIDVPGDAIHVYITPTYSGCPAMDAIAINIRLALLSHGYMNVDVVSVLSPPWTTDWMSDEGRRKLSAYGIAPPGTNRNTRNLFEKAPSVRCPQCNSENTHMLSEFGSTACKALYQCNDCKEPFDAFKCH
jgi:ring-1,2-phenylacetyl-CoA epoxidase subunit PaaD